MVLRTGEFDLGFDPATQVELDQVMDKLNEMDQVLRKVMGGNFDVDSITKLVSYKYVIKVKTDNESSFGIPLITYSPTYDSIVVSHNGVILTTEQYSTSIDTGAPTLTISNRVIRANDVLYLIIYKNVPISESNTSVAGTILEVGSIPHNRLVGLSSTDKVATVANLNSVVSESINNLVINMNAELKAVREATATAIIQGNSTLSNELKTYLTNELVKSNELLTKSLESKLGDTEISMGATVNNKITALKTELSKTYLPIASPTVEGNLTIKKPIPELRFDAGRGKRTAIQFNADTIGEYGINFHIDDRLIAVLWSTGQLSTWAKDGSVAVTATNRITDPVNPPLYNGWRHSTYPVKYYKDGLDRVYIEGEIKGGNLGYDVHLWTMPVGYRPSTAQSIFTLAQDAQGSVYPGMVRVFPSGEVRTVINNSGNLWLHILGSYHV
ncbi:tail protein [Bacillus phage vB_BceM-HSE3]|nr:tail protein [Bacillus phage vB_BceM-HSE3]